MTRRVEKPWGAEDWIVVSPHYVAKHLYVNPGQELSLQYHNEKHETMIVLEGMGEAYMGNIGMAEFSLPVQNVSPAPISVGDTITIPPKTTHKIRAFTGLKILEISTPHLKDLVRVEDRYGRE